MTIQQMVDNVKKVEQEHLIDAIRRYGNNMEVRFFEPPTIACYCFETPEDIRIRRVSVKPEKVLVIDGEDHNDIRVSVLPEDVFPGQLDHITQQILNENYVIEATDDSDEMPKPRKITSYMDNESD